MWNSRTKWILGFLVLLLLILTLGSSLYTKAVDKAINLALEQMLTPRQYTYDLGKTDLSIIKGNLSIKNITLRPIRKTDNPQADTSPSQLEALSADGIALKGFSILKTLFGKQLELREIKVEGLGVHLRKGAKKDTLYTDIDSEKATWLDSLQFMGVKRIDLQEIEILRTAIFFTDSLNTDTLDIYTGHSLRIKGLYFASNDRSDYLRMYVDKMGFSLQNQNLEFPVSGYTLSYDALNYKAENRILELENFRFNPTDDPHDLASSYELGKDVYQMEFPKISAYGFRLRTLLRKGVFLADSIAVNQFDMALIRDHSLPKDFQRKRILPSEGIDSLGVPIKVSKIFGSGGTIKYTDFISREVNFLEAQLGVRKFELLNITTKHFPSQKKDTLILNSSGTFASEAVYTISLKLPYGNRLTDIYFSGEVGPFPMTLVNPMVRPMEGLWFEEGYCQKIYFTSSCSEIWCQGDLRFLYTDLKMSIEEKDSPERSGLKSLVANLFARKNNPVRDNLKIGDMAYSRQVHMSMVNLITNGILRGIEDTVKP